MRAFRSNVKVKTKSIMLLRRVIEIKDNLVLLPIQMARKWCEININQLTFNTRYLPFYSAWQTPWLHFKISIKVYNQTRISIFNNTRYSLTTQRVLLNVDMRVLVIKMINCSFWWLMGVTVLLKPILLHVNHSVDYTASTVRNHFKILTTTAMLLSLPELWMSLTWTQCMEN